MRGLVYMLVFLWSAACFAQKGVDSLSVLLKSAKSDTDRVRLMVQIALKYGTNDPETALKYCKQALAIVSAPEYDTLSANSQRHAANAWRALGMTYYVMGDYLPALGNLNKALATFQKIGNLEGAAGAYGWIGNVHYSRGDFQKALEALIASLKIQERLNNKIGVAGALNGIANIYHRQRNLKKALEYYFQSLEIRKETNDSINMAYLFNNLGLLYADADSTSKALEYHFKCLQIVERFDDKRGMSNSYGNIGELLTKQKKYAEALKYLVRSLGISESVSDKNGMSASHYDIGQVYAGMGDARKAIISFNKGLGLSLEIGDMDASKDIYHELSKVYSRVGDFPQALAHYERYTSIKDSLMNEGNTRNLEEMQARFDTEKKEQEIELLQKDKNIRSLQMSEQEANIKRQRIVIYSAILGLLLVITLIFFIWKSYRDKKRINLGLERKNIEINIQKNQIEEKNLLITDSIDYARNIQHAILPTNENIEREFPGSFVLFMPKDIVSGDFYWMKQKGDKTYFAAVDCTGHGVPGAFMSVMAYNMLENISSQVSQPSLILDELNREILAVLHQESEEASAKFGMDISLVAIDKKTMQLEFAGAHNSLLIFSEEKSSPFQGGQALTTERSGGGGQGDVSGGRSQTQEQKLLELKANRATIGMAREPFTNYVASIEAGDMLYMFTDGYPDQKGGPQNKKFLGAELKKRLAELAPLAGEEQKGRLQKLFIEWKGSKDQMDDVLVVGIRT